MDFEALLKGFLAKTNGIDEDQIASLVKNEEGGINEDALEQILKLDSERVSKLKEGREAYGNERYGKGREEALSKFEKKVREQYGIESNSKGVDLIQEIISANSGGDVKKVEDAARLSEKVKWENVVSELKQSHSEEIDNLKLNFQRDALKSTLAGKAKDHVLKGGYKLPKDNTIAQNQLSNFEQRVSSLDVRDIDGTFIVFENGSAKQDAHGNTIKFDSHIAELASLNFEKDNSNPRIPHNGQQNLDVKPPIKSPEEFNDALKEAKTPAEKREVFERWTGKKLG